MSSLALSDVVGLKEHATTVLQKVQSDELRCKWKEEAVTVLESADDGIVKTITMVRIRINKSTVSKHITHDNHIKLTNTISSVVEDDDRDFVISLVRDGPLNTDRDLVVEVVYVGREAVAVMIVKIMKWVEPAKEGNRAAVLMMKTKKEYEDNYIGTLMLQDMHKYIGCEIGATVSCTRANLLTSSPSC